MEQRQEDENGINGGEEDVRVDTKVVARQVRRTEAEGYDLTLTL